MRAERNSETKLNSDEEKSYRGWLSKNGQIPGLGEVDKSWNGRHYDLRGVYKKYGPIDLKSAKIPDEFKKEESGNPIDWNKSSQGVGLTQGQDAPWANASNNPGNIVGLS